MSTKMKVAQPDTFVVKPARLGSERYVLTIIIVISVLLRIVASAYLGDQVVELPGTADQVSYDMLAQQVLAGRGFTVVEAWWPATPAGESTAHWSYLYTLYLAVIYGLFGYHPVVARLVQAIVAGLLMPWLLYRLGRRYFNPKVGIVAASLSAVYIYFIYYAAALMTETFYIVTILWVFDLVGQLTSTSTGTRNRRFVLYGLLLGIALAATVLLRQVFLLLVPFLFGWLIWRSYRHQVRPLLQMLAVVAIAGLTLIISIIPWTYRNYQAFDEFVLLNTNAGFAFYWGNHPIHGYNFLSILPADGPSYQELIPQELRQLNEAELDRALLKRGLSFIGEDPGRYFVLSLSRLKDYFKFWPSAESSLISNLSRVLSFGLLLPFMIYGLFYSWRHPDSNNISILYLFVVIYTGIHIFSWSLIRYRLPVDAVLLVFASVTFIEINTKLSRYPTKFQDIATPIPHRFRE